MASLNYRTRGTTSFNRAQKKAHVLPAALRENQEYLKAYDDRTTAYNNLHTAREALKSARKRLKNHYDYESMDLAMREGQHRHKLNAAQRKKEDDIISNQLRNIPKHHSDFAALHEEMRAIEKRTVPKIKPEHRLARTHESNPFKRGKMYGKFGIHKIVKDPYRTGKTDRMEPVSGDHQDYMKGGRRKKTRKKRRRKNKRKTKRRKKTRRRKKRRKKRRTKRR